MSWMPPAAAERPFRFGVVAAATRSAQEWFDKARRAEALGYATLVMPDNLQHTLPRWVAAPLGVSARDLAERRSIATMVGTTDQMCAQLLER